MINALMGALALAVFGIFWLSSQEWFDFLPRRVRRQIRTGSVMVLCGAVILVPNAFQQGVTRFVGWSSARTQAQYQVFIDSMVESQKSRVRVTPAPTAGQTAQPKPTQ